MTAPIVDGRSMLERARELRRLGGIDAHERSGEIADALDAVMVVVELAITAQGDSRASAPLTAAIRNLCAPMRTVDGGHAMTEAGIADHRRRAKRENERIARRDRKR